MRVSRWDIVLVALDPAIGSEANKTRPAVVVSNDGLNRAAGRKSAGVITVLPITSNVDRIYDFQVLIDDAVLGETGLRDESKIQAEQIRSVDIRRINGVLGRLPSQLIEPVERALAVHLDLYVSG